MEQEGPVPEVSGSSRRVREYYVSSEAGGSGNITFIVKPDGPVWEKSGHKIICPGTCYHTTGIMLR